MDNLEKLWCHSVTTDEETCGKTISCSYAENIACFITDKNYLCTYQHYKLNSTGASRKITGNGKLKLVHYLSFYDNIFAATDFDWYVYGRHTFQTKFSFVTPKPISDICWNPTETSLAVTFDSDEVALYHFSGCQFELTHTTDLHSEVTNSVYVGWGSHNTQFQGPRGRAPVETVEELPVSDEPPKIVWRNQGEQFAVNFQKCGKRFIKVFDKELNALYMTSEFPNLGRTVSFMSLGQCIASSAVRNDVNIVVIFEKNCKVKSTFEVPENKGIIKKVEYHPHMNMLAVYSVEKDCTGYINIYLNVNAKWYLKHQLYFPPNREVREFQWVIMPEASYTICKMVVFTSKNIEYHTFRFIVNRCPGTSVIAAIDGKNIDFYSFSRRITPPPMKLTTLDFPRPLNQILFHPRNSVAIVLDSKLQGYIIDMQTRTRLFNTEDMDLPNIACFHDVNWTLGNKILINIAYNGKDEHVATKESSGFILQIKTFEMTTPQYVLPFNDTDALVSYKILDDRLCALMYLTRRVVEIEGIDTILEFALSSNHEFYVNEELVCCGVNSLYVFKHYLMFTTVNAKLYSTRLLEDTSLFDKEIDFSKLFVREIEPGARIITVSTIDVPQIILNVPRGNLEVVTCKMMAVDVIEQYLSDNKWKKAVKLMRTAKINWNLLVDLNPDRFLLHVPEFVQATKYCSTLNAIVNEFGNIDESYTAYLPKTVNVSRDKSEIVLNILQYLITNNCVDNLICIVSIQQKHVSVKSALNSIKDVFALNSDECRGACKRALQQVLLKSNHKDVLDAAYSFFDLDFLRFIYSNTSQDPRLYETELEELKGLSQVELRYQMSLKANDPKTALKYLMRCDQYDAAYIEAYVLRHKLEAYGYTSLPPSIRLFSLVAHLYAKLLSKQKKHSEAGFVLKRVKMMREALDEFVEALDWMEAVIIMDELGTEEDEKKRVFYLLADGLVRAHRIDEAVLLVEHYNKDYEKAIQILVEHNAFKRAIGLARIYGATVTLEEVIIPTMTAYMDDLNEKIREYRVTFEKYVRRLKIVRDNRKMSLDNQVSVDFEHDEMVSETGSTSSGSSRGTSRTRGSTMSSRNRRKEERKKIDLREGGHYEDIALMRALYLLITDVFSLGQDVRQIGLTLEHDSLNMARLLHEKLAQLQDDMRKEIPEIWPEGFLISPPYVDNYILAVTQNKADLDPKYWTPPPEEILNAKWKLEMFSVNC